MNVLEARWLGKHLAEIPSAELFPVLDVGGQTLEFRTRTQPYIDEHVFAPLRARGGQVWHLDVIDAPGVDIVGNMCDPVFLAGLRARFPVRTAILSNVLEHVVDRFGLARAVLDVVPDGGRVLVCGPTDYPYHAEPLDTMFRPTLGEVLAYFPGTRVVDSRQIDSGNCRQWNNYERGRSLGRALARMCVPFYRPRQWVKVFGQIPFLFRHIRAYMLLLEKQPVSVPADRIGVVVIGRNEGARLVRCLRSVTKAWTRVMYVDSGSSDGSPARAREMGVEVVELDRSMPFTAARGRNAGFERLGKIEPGLKWMQFVDGDCEMQPGWWAAAQAELIARPDFAIVFGRARERFPEASIYNRLCDMEWNTTVGEREESGGTIMARAAALAQVGGYNPSFIAGEEPEMCVRLRQCGWRVLRIEAEMSWHDADMHRFSQWWRRETRGGHAAAEGAATHGHLPERHRVRESRRNWAWGFVLPLLVAITTACFGWIGLTPLALYPVLLLRVYQRQRRRGERPRRAALYAVFCVVSKFPQAIGAARYWRGRLFSKPSRLIEYKGTLTPTSPVDPAS